MTQPTSPIVPIELDRERRMKLDFNALAAYEEITGRSPFVEGWNPNSVRDIRAFLFACLKHEDPALTLEAVGAQLHFGNMLYVSEQLALLLNQALPQNASRPTSEAAPKKRTGTNSKPSLALTLDSPAASSGN